MANRGNHVKYSRSSVQKPCIWEESSILERARRSLCGVGQCSVRFTFCTCGTEHALN